MRPNMLHQFVTLGAAMIANEAFVLYNVGPTIHRCSSLLFQSIQYRIVDRWHRLDCFWPLTGRMFEAKMSLKILDTFVFRRTNTAQQRVAFRFYILGECINLCWMHAAHVLTNGIECNPDITEYASHSFRYAKAKLFGCMHFEPMCINVIECISWRCAWYAYMNKGFW